MCGITGFYNFNTDRSKVELQSLCEHMTDSLTHRGPDAGGVWQDPNVALLLGHRRLSILDLSDDGAQPMSSHTDRYVIAYNGEIYNYLPLQRELERAGLSFKGRSDTEVILGAIEHWGLNLALQKLNGMFAFVLWDRKERHLHFMRDRMGKKPLYIAAFGNNVAFSSELKALRAHPDFNPELNIASLELFMRYGCVPAPHSIYKNVWSLPAGFYLSLDLNVLKPGTNLSAHMKPYWHHKNAIDEAKAAAPERSEAETIDAFEELLTQCVQDRLISDVPVGAFLSGGIDSSTVVALMQKGRSQPVQTYAIGFEEKGYDEAPYAQDIAQHLGTDHHELYVSAQDARDVIPHLPTLYDEPFADISAIPTYLVSGFARKNITVALSGDGGDEMLGGYNRHIFGPKIWNKTQFMPVIFRQALAHGLQAIPQGIWDKVAKSHPQFGLRMHKTASILAKDTQEAIYERLVTHWENSPLLQETRPATLLEDPAWAPGEHLSFAEKMMYFDALSYLPNDILVKVDRASMAHGLEARAPLLDRRIYDFVWGLPESYKIRGGQGKWLLRQVLHRHVPATLFERPKQGFAMPVDSWLRGSLRDWAEELLSPEHIKAQGLFDEAQVSKVWNAHLNGHGQHKNQLWTLLMFQAWMKEWM